MSTKAVPPTGSRGRNPGATSRIRELHGIFETILGHYNFLAYTIRRVVYNEITKMLNNCLVFLVKNDKNDPFCFVRTVEVVERLQESLTGAASKFN